VRDQPFSDGNKRVALVTMGVFLGLNGQEIDAPETEMVAVMLNLAAGELSEEQHADWIRSRLKTAARRVRGQA
jgi:death on curing protein